MTYTGIFQVNGVTCTASFINPETEQNHTFSGRFSTALEPCQSTDATFNGNIDDFIGARQIIGGTIIGSTKFTIKLDNDVTITGNLQTPISQSRIKLKIRKY
jgi:hypothetical protein